jgi:hypothetical protein
MRRGVPILLAAAIALFAAPADARKRHKSKAPSGIEGVVLDSTCYGPCVEPPPPEPAYTGAVTITVQRVSDGGQVASEGISDGHFQIRLSRGLYDVSSVPPNPTPPPCGPGQMCLLDGAGSAAIIAPCLQGETKRVQVRRHHFARVELHVSNVCIV